MLLEPGSKISFVSLTKPLSQSLLWILKTTPQFFSLAKGSFECNSLLLSNGVDWLAVHSNSLFSENVCELF